MKKLIYKELKLVMLPPNYIFPLLAALLLIPAYPYSVGMMYCILSIFIIFSTSKANKDIEFTSILPVPRNAIVKAKHFDVIFIQLMQVIFAIPFAILTSLLVNPNGNLVGLDANFTFFGITLISFSIFNLIFLPWFFKSCYKLGWPIFIGAITYALFILVSETIISVVPVLKNNLDGLNPQTFGYQIIVLIVGVIAYFLSTLLSYKLSVKNFNNISL